MSAGPALPEVRVARTTAFSCMAGTHLLGRANGVGIDPRGFGQRDIAYLAVIAGAGVRGDVITAMHLNSLRLGGARWTLETAHPAGLAQREHRRCAVGPDGPKTGGS